ncbi:MAG: hypothetical protein OXF77_00940 [Thaumarchaeota archaeon]|nr:hypothetical protein [Nitrososphaerota archaeon]
MRKIIGWIKNMNCPKALKAVGNIVHIVVVLALLNMGVKLLSSDISGGITILGTNEQGQFRVLEIKGRKMAPQMQKNLLSVGMTDNFDKEFTYQRHIYELWGFHLYTGVGVNQMMIGTTEYKVVLTIGF